MLGCWAIALPSTEQIVVIMAEEDEATLTEDEPRNPFNDTSSEEELGTE